MQLNIYFQKKKNPTINLGPRLGHSVLDVINKTRQISKKAILYDIKERRHGDSDKVIANPDLAKKVIGWEAKHSELNTIINSKWELYRDNQ
tara:strand:- start:5892 stop:6164 length:273 start_codon:yes stop_codon:yes gene_type:complete